MVLQQYIIFRPGDRVLISGIFRAVPRRNNVKMRSVNSVFKTFIDAIHFELNYSANHKENNTKDKNNAISNGINVSNTSNDESDDELADDFENTIDNDNIHHIHEDKNSNINNNITTYMFNNTKTTSIQSSLSTVSFSAAEIKAFHKFASREDVYSVLLQSFAPSVYAMQDVKQGLLCLLFGGTYSHNHPVSNSNSSITDLNNNASPSNTTSANSDSMKASTFEMHMRGDINILLCGDPGTSKSQLLTYVHNLSSRGIYTSGEFFFFISF